MKYLLLGLFTLSSWAQAGDVWLSMNSSILASIQDSLPKKTVIQNVGSETGVFQIDSKLVPDISESIHHKLKRCGGFFSHQSETEAKDSVERLSFWKNNKSPSLLSYDIDAQGIVHAMVENVSADKMEQTILSLSNFKTRFYTSPDGLESSRLIQRTWAQMSGGRSDISVELFNHRSFSQPTVILTILGSETPQDIVILGAHADSISSGKIAPGADDNASGVAAVTEVLRLLIEHDFRPKKTIKLMAYAAEEVGLLGSEDVAKSFKKAKKNVIGVLQLDMTLFKGSRDKDIILISDYTHRKQNEFLGKLIDEYVKVPWGYDRCGYGCSDHASWMAHGYPASFPFESKFDSHNPYIHTEKDTLENSGDVSHSVPFTKLALAYIVEMST
jgi:leucyl aminopeptidase